MCFVENALPSAFNTAATPSLVPPLPTSSIAGKLCCDHRHFMRYNYRHFMNQPSHALNAPLMQYALKRVYLRIHLQMKRHQIYHAEPPHLRPVTQAKTMFSRYNFIYQSKLACLQTQTHVHCLHSLFTAPPLLPTARAHPPLEAAARPSHGSGNQKRRKRRAATGMVPVKHTHTPPRRACCPTGSALAVGGRGGGCHRDL